MSVKIAVDRGIGTNSPTPAPDPPMGLDNDRDSPHGDFL